MTYKTLAYPVEGSAGLTESLSWLTELSKARDATEKATKVRAYPRYRYEFSVPAVDAQSRQVLADVRSYSGDWLIPLWPHIAPGETLPRAVSSEGRLLSVMPDGTFAETVGVPFYGAVDTLPAGIGRLVDSARIQHTTEGVAVVRLAFNLLNYQEPVSPWTSQVERDGVPVLGYAGDGLPVFGFAADWTDSVSEEVSRVGETLDNDILWSERVFYVENRHTATIALFGDAEIRQFRAFLWHCAGRFGRFYMSPPDGGDLTLYRLDTDTVEILYRLSNDPAECYATTKLSFLRLA